MPLWQLVLAEDEAWQARIAQELAQAGFSSRPLDLARRPLLNLPLSSWTLLAVGDPLEGSWTFEDIRLEGWTSLACLDGTGDLLLVLARKEGLEPASVPLAHLELVTMLQMLRRQDAAGRRLANVNRLPGDPPLAHLSGAVAHDLNNLLTVIRGNCELMRDVADQPALAEDLLGEIVQAQEQASMLTRHLLSLSQQQELAPQVIELNGLLSGMTGLLRCLLGKRHQLLLDLDAQDCPIHIAPGHIERILLNLLCNARDAMTMVGRVSVATRAAQDDAGKPIVRLTIHDSGPGMDERVRARMFEPFVTTKPRGRGLGLAIVASIVEEGCGRISVTSQPGQGTTFDLEFPRAGEGNATQAKAAQPLTAAAETILLVEDDNLVRSVFRRILQSCGYFVIEAANGKEALLLAEHFSMPIHLVVTDLNLPHVSGIEVARRAKELHPESKVLLVSGFSEECSPDAETVDTRYPLLLKPFTAETLLERVRSILGQG